MPTDPRLSFDVQSRYQLVRTITVLDGEWTAKISGHETGCDSGRLEVTPSPALVAAFSECLKSEKVHGDGADNLNLLLTSLKRECQLGISSLSPMLEIDWERFDSDGEVQWCFDKVRIARNGEPVFTKPTRVGSPVPWVDLLKPKPRAIPRTLWERLQDIRHADDIDLMRMGDPEKDWWDHLIATGLPIGASEGWRVSPITLLGSYLPVVEAATGLPRSFPHAFQLTVDAEGLPASPAARVKWARNLLTGVQRTISGAFGVPANECLVWCGPSGPIPSAGDSLTDDFWASIERVDKEWPIAIDAFDASDDRVVILRATIMSDVPFISSRLGRQISCTASLQLSTPIHLLRVCDGGIGAVRQACYIDGERDEGAFACFVDNDVELINALGRDDDLELTAALRSFRDYWKRRSGHQ